MKILVTGGAGFIGSAIAQEYLRLGHDVVIVDDLSTGFLENVPRGAEFYQLDIRDEGIGEILDRHSIEIINHHAAQIDVRKSVQDPKLDVAINVLGSINLLEAAVARGIARFIFASTGGAIYGEQDYYPADEEHATNPVSPYGISKLCVEKFLNYYRAERGLTSTILRYTNVYGPRQSPHGEAGVVAIFCDKMLSGRTPIINGDGLQTRDYVFVSDVARANVLALGMDDGVSGVFNVCTGVETNVTDIFTILNETLDSPVRRTHGPEKPGEQRRSVCAWEKISRTLGWLPEVEIETGLNSTMDYFKSRSGRMR